MCSFISQLQLHDGGVKIHEIIYEQVGFWVDPCAHVVHSVAGKRFRSIARARVCLCRPAGCCRTTTSRSALRPCGWCGCSASSILRGKAEGSSIAAKETAFICRSSPWLFYCSRVVICPPVDVQHFSSSVWFNQHCAHSFIQRGDPAG